MEVPSKSKAINNILRFTGYNDVKKKYTLTMKIYNEKLIFEAYSENDYDKFY